MDKNYISPYLEVIEFEIEDAVLGDSGIENGTRENAF